MTELRRIESETWHHSLSSLWFSVRKYRITTLYFGEIFKHLPTTPPHHLVVRIIDPNCAATEWGKIHQTCAFEKYQKYHHSRGNPNRSNAGFATSENHPFLGVPLDSYVYDPSTLEFLAWSKLNALISTVDMHQLKPDFFYELTTAQSSGDQTFQLWRSHSYYRQVQG